MKQADAKLTKNAADDGAALPHAADHAFVESILHDLSGLPREAWAVVAAYVERLLAQSDS